MARLNSGNPQPGASRAKPRAPGALFSFAALLLATPKPQSSCIRSSSRGVLFSFAALLLAICIISFAAISAEWSVQSRQTAARLVDFDRTTDAYSNAEEGLLSISSLATSISVENSTVSISSPLPAPDMAVYLRRFAEFESNFSDFPLTANTSSLESRTFSIMPQNIEIRHQQDRLIIEPLSPGLQGGAPASYDVEVIFPTATIDAAAWSVLYLNATGGVPVRISVRDARYAVLFDFYETVSRANESVLNITSAGATAATVRIRPDSALEVQSPQAIDLKTSIGLSIPAYVETNDRISVVSAVNKTGRLRVGG